MEKDAAVLKVQRLFRRWFLRKRPHLCGAFATYERVRRQQAWVYPTHPSRVFSRFLVEVRFDSFHVVFMVLFCFFALWLLSRS